MALSLKAQRVQEVLTALGFPYRVEELREPTRSAAEAARAVRCDVRQIAKSLVFQGMISGRMILVIAAGANRVDPSKIAGRVGEPVVLAKPGRVKEVTGFAIGGVPPIAHAHPMPTLIDCDLLEFDRIWAAAGTPRALFQMLSSDLPRMTDGELMDLKAI